jgi:enoyl-[acyl-carrier protein] reductase I
MLACRVNNRIRDRVFTLELAGVSGHRGTRKEQEHSGASLMAVESLMKGKRGLIMGVANDRSIAWGIAQALHQAGADLAFSYQGEAFRKRVLPLIEPLKPAAIVDCDVTNQGSIDAMFAELQKKWGTLDFVVHAIAFSDKEQLKGRYVDTTQENFQMTMNISCYSFTAVAQRAEKMMPNGGSMVTLTYYGAEKVMPHYNVMGVAKAALEASVRYMAEDLGKKNIRVNAISAGPIKTLAFAGIADSRYLLKWNEYNSPLRRNVTTEEVGGTALFLLSDLGKAVTGECLHVDAGYHIVGMKAEDAPDIVVGKPDGA